MARSKKYTNRRSINLNLTGLEEYAQRIVDTGRNVDDAVAKAVHESAQPVYEDIKDWAQRHRRTGVGAEGADLSDPEQSGNDISVAVGINDEKAPGSWHMVFTEYGTPTQPADPGIRNAFDNNKSKVKKIQREVLKREGMPID
ncbi:HK97-gp10 family putative phage morphogenesis protein [Paenibacillus senegalimassiliensis]|uniref:HK97-gp10 family putative phage morphogenesis protein n=1 Tax=Paenibacillus senegalimassiliensis TaxID=1737426 RepID=UPI00073EECD5|nr:HK97-gp10 family putative phage morphogenesis protein [Paenibacillus senegalimassiliensis]